MPILQACYNLDNLKHCINQRICELNKNEINSIYYNAMSLEYVLPTDVLQHVLLFNHSEDIQTVSKTFKQCMDKNKNILHEQEYLDINVDKIESCDEALNMLNHARKVKLDLLKEYNRISRQHTIELNESIEKIEALRDSQLAMVQKIVPPLQKGILNEKIKALSAKLRNLTPPIEENTFPAPLIYCMGCGEICGEFVGRSFHLCCPCGTVLCGDCHHSLDFEWTEHQSCAHYAACLDCCEFQLHGVDVEDETGGFYCGHYVSQYETVSEDNLTVTIKHC